MAKKFCEIEQEERDHITEKDKTPQGWPMVVEVCMGCKRRALMNDPEADYKAENPDETEA